MENSKKIERLDNAFLFIISIVGLFFTIIQIYIEGILGLVEISPLFFLGIILPFYVGYLRGAIELDSVMERTRGWVYLTVGISTYVAILLTRIDPNFYFLFIVIAFFLIYYLERWFNTIFEIEDDISNLYAFYGTTISGFSLAFGSYHVIRISSELLLQPSYSTSLLSSTWLACAFSIIFILLEKLSRNVIGVKLPLTQEEIEIRRKLCSSLKLLASALFIFGLEFFYIVFEVDLKIAFFWFQAICFGMLGFFFYNVPVFADIFLFASIIFATLGSYLFVRLKEINFSKVMSHLQIIRH